MPRNTPAARPQQLDMDLEEFGQHVDETLGRTTGFADSVTQWRSAATTLNRWSGRGKGLAALHAVIDREIASQSSDRAVVTGRGPRAVRRYARPARTTERILSAKVKAVNEKLWEASRVPGIRLGNFTTGVERAVWVPPEPRTQEVLDLAGRLDQVKEMTKRARAVQTEHGEIVKVIVTDLHDRGEWPAELCYALTDGWELGFSTTLTFRESVTRELLSSGEFSVPNLGALIGTSTQQAGFVYRVLDKADALGTDEDGEWIDEYDEIDGD